MSLYYEAASALETASRNGESLKSYIYNLKNLKNSPSHIFALTAQATKWSTVLKEVIERSGILSLESKLSLFLSLLLVHDLLLSKQGVAAPPNHALRLAVTRHKARLASELTRVRLKLGYPSLEALRAHVESAGSHTAQVDTEDDDAAISPSGYPRWVRINTLRTSLEKQLASTFAGYVQSSTFSEVLKSHTPAIKTLYIDEHIPNLIALPPGTDLTKTKAYLCGELILQDKASCMPAYLMNPGPTDANIIDACAAPGNKTTHIAAILNENGGSHQTVWACERDKARSETLKKMIDRAVGDQGLVRIKAGQDFLKLSPEDPTLGKVGALLLDPSCSGSGIVGRHAPDQGPKLVLPELPQTSATPSKGKKRKRGMPAIEMASPATGNGHAASPLVASADSTPDHHNNTQLQTDESLNSRLIALSTFQLKLLLHAFNFPHARKITYSTCSIHAAENEHVVMKALASSTAKKRGWRILRRDEQVDGLRRWHVRGDVAACRDLLGDGCGEDADVDRKKGDELRHGPDVVADACIRCDKGTEDGTMGFFVAAFVRDVPDDGTLDVGSHPSNGGSSGAVAEVDDEEEWQGFRDEEAHELSLMVEAGVEDVDGTARPKTKKRKKTTAGH